MLLKYIHKFGNVGQKHKWTNATTLSNTIN